MASTELDVELEDGEINDLEDGEIDEGAYFPGESIFSRLEPRQEDFCDELSHVSFEPKLRELPFHNIQSSTRRWKSVTTNFARGRHSKGRPGYSSRASKERLKPSRECAREQLVPGKSFYRRKDSYRRPFQQQQNLPHGLPVERHGAPFLNERGPVVNHDRPRLPHFGPLERQRSPLPSLGERFRQSYVKRQDFTPPLPVEEHRRSSPFEEEVDDYSLLLERHRLIQQQLEALEKQESLADDDIIDDTFVDIPIEDDEQSLERSREWENNSHSKIDSQDLVVDSNDEYFEIHSENYALEAENDTRVEELMKPKVFLPFKIRTQYSTVPSIQELSRKDLEQKQTKQEDDGSTSIAIDNVKDLGSDQYIRTDSQVLKKVRATKTKRNRQRRRKRKLSRSITQSKTRNGKLEKSMVGGSNVAAQSHVDPHNELEARLMSLATSSVPTDPSERVEGKGDDAEKQRQRREKLKQWQERRLQNDFPGIRDQQQGNVTRSKKKVSKLGVGSKRRTGMGERKSEVGQGEKERDMQKFDADDYYEIPMEVESDSPDGPALPLIEETLDNMPPPPPPLPNSGAGTGRMESYSDHSQQPILLYPGGYYPTGQICSDWMAGPVPLMHTVIEDQQPSYEDYAVDNGNLADVDPFYYIKLDRQHPQTMDIASQENSDEDDEAALRELLLKSLADKRKSKKTVREETNSLSAGSVPSSPRVQSPKTVSSSGASLQSIKQHSKQQSQNSRQVTFAPPKHDPVVIKLGEDSDTEDSDATDTEPSAKADTNAKSRRKLNSGGLFGGLEMMIKEARKSAEASKVKEGQSVAQKGDVEQPCNTDLPPEPTTPEAMAHMPEQMKTEYRRLKEQLALRESKSKQPPTSFNAEKADSVHETSSTEEPAETATKDDNIRELHIWVRECEVSLANHRKCIKLDQSSLSNMIAELLLKKQSLEAEEAKVRKLQQQLEAAQKVALASRLLIAKMRDQFKLKKERTSKKQQEASNLEEELLRTKSILSATKSRQPMIANNDPGRNSPETESLEDIGSQNQKIVITPSIAEEIKSSLDAKLNKLLSTSKDKKGDVQTKRKLEETSHSSDETVGKKAKPQVSSPHGGSPSKTMSSSVKKSAMAERIAQEKARLKKLEHELSEKLKTYSKETERESKAASANTGQSSAEHSKCDVRIQKPVLTVGCKNGPPLVEGTQQGNKSSKDSELRREPSAPVMEISVDDEQLDCIRKLQAEKEKKGPQFPSFNLDIPLAAHEWPTICVSLPFGSELKSLVREEDTSSVGDGGRGLVEYVAAGISGMDGFKDVACPLEKYRSKLLHFKSYRLSSYFRTQEGFSLSSLSFTNKLDPLWPLCDFELKGKCNDEDCRFQHVVTCKLLEEEMLQDLASYDPSLAVDGKSSKELSEGILSYTKSFAKQYQDKMSWEELCILLVSKIKAHKKISGPYHIFLKPRAWKVKQIGGKQTKYEEETVQDLGRGIKLSNKDESRTQIAGKKAAIDTEAIHLPGESQELRYFVEEYNNMKSLEESLEKSPSNVPLWIKLARLQLSQKVSSGHQKDLDTHNNNIRQALNTLSRGLEENTLSEELWLEYLDLYASQSNSVELREICEQAVEFSPTYSIWWQYLEHLETYHDKKAVGLRLLSFLATNHSDPVELHSHRLLEVLLYLVQLELYCGHYRSALTIFQAALAKKPSRSYEVPDFSVCVLPSDCCLAWLAYIHVVEFHRLPALWFDPCQSRPSRMVSKEEFVFPWKPSQHSRASGEKLLGLFQDALKACVYLARSPADRYIVCLPLYKNLIALEIAYDRVSSARGICKHLLKDNYSDVFLWLSLAVLEQKIKGKDAMEQIHQEAMDKCVGHALLAYTAARFFLEKSETQKAITVLVRCVYHKFEDIGGSPKDEVRSLAVSMPRMDAPDPVALYRKLLSQPLPYDYKCPPLMPGVASQLLGKEKVYLWLCYCLLLEISSSASAVWNTTVESAFETAVHSLLEQQDIQTLWTEYLFYLSSKVLQGESSSSLSSQQAMEELVNRCLMCISTNSPLPHSSCCFWQDYRFHNQVIRLSLSCLPKSHWPTTFERYLRLFPGDSTLALWACQHELELNNLDQAKRIIATFLSDNPSSITMWKVYHSLTNSVIAIELKRKCVKEARKMYQQATEILPFAATLWKDFLMFEIAQSGNGSAVQELMGKCRQIGVDLEEFLNTLLGK